MKIVTKNPKETQNIAKNLAKEILKKPYENHTAIIGLIGELGSGKTTFVKGFAKGLGIKHVIQSPTFIIVRRHLINKKNYKNFYHIDAYRVGPKDLLALGWRNWGTDSSNIILVEWADRISKVMPKKYLKITFEALKNGKRKIIIQ